MALRAWTPADLSTQPAAWWDAQTPASLTTVGGAVSSWADKRATGLAATQPTAGSRPSYSSTGLNGYPCVSNAGGATLNAAASAISGFPQGTVDRWCVLVASPTASTSNRIAFGYGNNASQQMSIVGIIGGNPGLSLYDSDYRSTATWTASAPGVLVVDLAAGSPASALIGFNGTRNTTATAANKGTGVTAGFQMFNFQGITAWTGAIGELIIGTGPLSLADFQRVEGYAAWRWGTQATLPASHPYKAAAPTVDDGAATSITGSSSGTLASIGTASAAGLAIVGAAALALASIGTLSNASAPIAAQAQAGLGEIVSAGAGGLSVTGACAATLQSISASGAATLPVLAVGPTPLGDVASSATGLLSAAGMVSSTLGPVGTVSAARADVRGTASTSLGSIVGVATAGGQSLATASGASVLGSVATTATGFVPVVGNGSTALATIASNSGAASAVRGAGGASLGAIVSSSASSIPIGAIGTANLGGVRADGRGGAIASAIASSTLGGILGTSSATVGQDTDNQLVGPGWTLFATSRRFIASAIRRSFIVSSTGCKRMLNFPPKYAHEVRNAVVDFAPALSEGEGLTGQPTVAVMKGDLAVSAARIEGTAVHFTLSGGAAATKVVQWVEVHCQTDGDQVLEEVVSVTMLS